MNDISLELAKLHILTGAGFIRQLKLIVSSGEFHRVEMLLQRVQWELHDLAELQRQTLH